MNLLRLLCLCALLSLPGLTSAEPDPDALQSQIDAKVAEIDRLQQQLDDTEQAADAVGVELERLRGESDALRQQKADTLAALQARFERVVEDPTLDLAAAQRDYRDAFEALAAHREAVAGQERDLADRQASLASTRDTVAAADAALATLRARFNRARFERLFRELNVVGEVTLTSTITCEADETIAGCIERGEQAARELARTRFRDQLLAAVTESSLVSRQPADGDAMPTLLESDIQRSGFQGQGDYVVELSAKLRNEVSESQACRLLGLTEAECRADAAPATSAASPPADDRPAEVTLPDPTPPELVEDAEEGTEPQAAPADGGQFRLTVRSNVYYDEVFIDGVAYGSTKLDVLLPAGEYDVEVHKPGHSVYRERIALSDSRTVSATLYELDE